MFTSLVNVDSGLSYDCAPISLALMASVPPSMVTTGLAAEDAAGGSYKTSYSVEMAVARFQHDPTDVE
jgi:hypothetical protein